MGLMLDRVVERINRSKDAFQENLSGKLMMLGIKRRSINNIPASMSVADIVVQLPQVLGSIGIIADLNK